MTNVKCTISPGSTTTEAEQRGTGIVPDVLQRLRDPNFIGQETMRQDAAAEIDRLQSALAAAESRYEQYAADCYACTPYLKEGETPAQCIQRNRDDVSLMLRMLAKERMLVEQQGKQLTAAQARIAALTAEVMHYTSGTPHPDTARIAEMEELAELGRVAMQFVDRAGDVCEHDPAEVICEQFNIAMSAAVELQRRARGLPSTASEQP